MSSQELLGGILSDLVIDANMPDNLITDNRIPQNDWNPFIKPECQVFVGFKINYVKNCHYVSFFIKYIKLYR